MASRCGCVGWGRVAEAADVTPADVHDDVADTPLVDRSTRTIRRWVTTAGERLYADTSDDGWTYLGPHDLRRT